MKIPSKTSIRWKMAGTYFVLIVLILGIANLFLLQMLERNYLGERAATSLANANIIATTGQDTLLRSDRNAYYLARDFGTRMGVRVLVLDRRGNIMVDSYDEEWLLGRSLRHQEVKTALTGTGQTGVHRLNSGEMVLYAAVPVLRDKSTAGVVMLVEGLDDLYAALDDIRRQMLLVSLVSGLLAALLSLGLAGLLTKPVKELTEAVRQVSAGHLEQHIPARSSDELGQLAAAFNEMSGRLAEADLLRRRFLADASHELKSPLSSVKALAQSLLETNEQDIGVYREYLADINSEMNRLARIVDHMLQLTRLEEEGPLVKENTAVAGLVEHVLLLLRPRACEGGVALQTDIDPALSWPVHPDLFTGILFNLVDNAIRHTPGGTVTVEAQVKKKDLIVQVADTGEGIPAEDLPHVFDRFYRVDKARSRVTGGTGLGLAVVRQAVHRHGGSIKVTSRPGEGTVFTLVLPGMDYVHTVSCI
ncbi:sensor histidine kinase [Desulfallas thermosapovorans]|uniref:histidine kinase n=1 Tax=Desulfallas thermosapovorans DSM 6562 TaxID=1121431 RepID=A0A5S4ZR49_9FIRM|nr:ATP-binding protein [Desulfallas thermosapovorans]TYO95392.1 signal transduction histidine kinase [Desulfallas thermosapovorans DSM 6562]